MLMFFHQHTLISDHYLERDVSCKTRVNDVCELVVFTVRDFLVHFWHANLNKFKYANIQKMN